MIDLLTYQTENIVIISKRAGGLITFPDSHNFTIIETPDVHEKINSMITVDKATPILSVIFLMSDEYRDCTKLLSVLPFSEITYQIVIFGKGEDVADYYFEDLRNISEYRVTALSADEFTFIVRKAFSVVNDNFITRAMQESYLTRLMDMRQDQDDLIKIGRSLSLEKNPERLLRQILFLSKRITGADAGSIYLVEDDEDGKKRLRFKYSHTFSREIPLEEFVMPMDKKSISGYVAVTGEVLNIPNAYNLPTDAPYSFNTSFDRTHSYQSRSMLVVPMRNHVDAIIGVIQLINSKENVDNRIEYDGEDEAFSIVLKEPEDFDNYVVTFDQKYDSLMEAVAGQAAIAIENNRMIAQIQRQFEEFVKASVTAIESRDPATSGHSFRVAEICKSMAEAVNVVHEGYLAQFKFNESEIKEIELAALLHDFGKVYIDLSVFMKAKKLFPRDLENLNLRLDYLYRFTELEYSARQLGLLERSAKEDDLQKKLDDLLGARLRRLNRIHEIKSKLIQMNEPAVTDEDPEEVLRKIIADMEELECRTVEGDHMDILTGRDITNLSIRRGSLNPDERREIESHVVHTYNFVSRIPWPPEYRNIPEIALRHHEKINGTGYPGGLKGRESTMLQARIMSIADVYDALAASDRPYKKALPTERVLKILKEEADRGVLDPDLVSLFIDKKIYLASSGIQSGEESPPQETGSAR